MTTKTNTPVHEIRFGKIKGTIWKNETPKGDRYNTSFTRLYRVDKEVRESSKDNGWRESHTFGREELLVIKMIANLAYQWIYEHSNSDE